jgi:hypothetical protein
MKAIFSIMIFLVVIGISGCENDNSPIILENGTYEGTFTLGYADGQTFSNPVTISFDGNNYSSSAGPNRYPAGGNGTFELSGDLVEFSDVNIWTADFDWGLILSGTYAITETNTYIEFLKNQNSGEGFYRYRLEKK